VVWAGFQAGKEIGAKKQPTAESPGVGGRPRPRAGGGPGKGKKRKMACGLMSGWAQAGGVSSRQFFAPPEAGPKKGGGTGRGPRAIFFVSGVRLRLFDGGRTRAPAAEGPGFFCPKGLDGGGVEAGFFFFFCTRYGGSKARGRKKDTPRAAGRGGFSVKIGPGEPVTHGT